MDACLQLRPYSFGYEVKDAAGALDFGHRETSDGRGGVSGAYHVLLPDGRHQVIDRQRGKRTCAFLPLFDFIHYFLYFCKIIKKGFNYARACGQEEATTDVVLVFLFFIILPSPVFLHTVHCHRK